MTKKATDIFLALIAAFVLLAGTACGGGEGAEKRTTLAWYGDSITSYMGQAHRISEPDFDVQDFSVGGKHSDSPIEWSDTADVVILRYGMADAAHGITPLQTRTNLLNLLAVTKAQGRRAIVINVSRTPTCLECATNAAIADLVDIDVRGIDGGTLDGIHPDNDFHNRMNKYIHDELVRLLKG